MLKFLNQDRCIQSVCNCQLPLTIFSETAEDHVHIPICNCDSNMRIKRCCLQNQRPNTCLPPLSFCVTNMDCLSCQSVAVGHFNSVVSKGNPVPCSPHGCCPKQLQQCKIHSAEPALCMHLCSMGQKTNKAGRARSPSPPSLSPVETDEYDSLEESIEDSLYLGTRLKTNSNQPPSLLPAERSFSACEQKDNISITEGAGNLDETLLSANQENGLIDSDMLEQVENSPFQDLMDRINEKLKSIETTDTTNVTRLSKNDGKTEADTKLRSFITSLLHDANPNDYNFMELLNQHDKEIENKIIQTRFRKRQETLFAMHKSPDSSLFRRQSLQIKRELANLDETFIRKKASSERNAKKLTKNDKLSPNKIAHHTTLNNFALQNLENKEKLFSSIKSKSLPVCPQESLELPLNNSGTNSGFVAFSENTCTTSQTHLVEIHGNCGVDLHMDPVPVKRDDNRLLDRTKHTVIPPMWCSVYVTNNFLANPHPYCMEKDKTLIDFQAKTCSSEDINKVVRNTNLHVVVERLEDTLNMAPKAKKPFFNGYTVTSKLKDIPKSDANNNSKSGLFYSVSETGSKGQYVLSQAHVPFSSNCRKECVSTKEKEITDGAYKIPWKSSNTFDSDILNSNNEDLQRNCDAGDNSSTTLNYTSPIKLMFLSEINSSEGVKYTLKSVNDASKLNIGFYSLHEKTKVPSEKQSEPSDLGKIVSIEECSYSENGNKDEVNTVFPTINETSINEHRPSLESIEQGCNGSSLKRKPGRPKKIGPQVVKQFKRPIGRPPKPKVAAAENNCCLSNSTSCKKSGSSNAGVLEGESVNKNITVTIVFGRSRRIKRCVSEGTVSVVSVVRDPHSDCDVLCESAQLKKSDTRDILLKNKNMPNSASGYEYVRPLESRPVVASHCSNIIRPNQKPLNIIRKPGRPAKVKISGISVTVNQISSQERKVSISSCLPPLEKETVFEKNESFKKENNQCNKRYVAETILNDTDEDFSPEKILASKKPEIPLRQSLRDRRPSLPFLHSLASASPLSCRRAFLQKSYKFCLKNVKDKTIQHHSSVMPKHTSINKDPDNSKKSSEHNKFRSIHEMSLDPIVSSNSLRWWDPSISNDSLLKELNSRYDQITSTWLNVNGEEFGKCLYDEECHTEQNCSINESNPLDSCILQLEHSPIKMLFQKKCNIDDLRTWFMETTETQSLSLVRKANARNPFEVISTRQIKMGTRQYDCNTSPLRKHFKKFALSTPSKSAGDLQILHKIGRSQVLNRKHKYTLAKLRKTRFENGQRDRWRQVKKLYNHGTSDWKSKRRNLRFFCRSQCFANGNRKISNQMCMNHRNCTVQSNSSSVLIDPHTVTSSTGNEIRDTFYQQKTQSYGFSTNPELKNNCTSSIQPAYCNQENNEKVRTPGEDGWRDKTFKNCRIFLKKINPVEEQLSFNTNPVVCTPESVSHNTSHSYFQEKRHCTLRSHSTKQSMSDSSKKNTETSKAAKYSTLVKGMHVEQDSKKSSKRVTFDDGPTEVPRKINKRGKTQCKLTDLDVRKRNKRQLCSAGQVPSCFSKYQIGPLKPVGLPLLGGFASRAVEYSMIPFQLPLHGSSQV